MNTDDLYSLGDRLRQELIGEERYAETSTGIYGTPLMKEFINVTTTTIFGALWARPGLDLKSRALVCVVSETGMVSSRLPVFRTLFSENWPTISAPCIRNRTSSRKYEQEVWKLSYLVVRSLVP